MQADTDTPQRLDDRCAVARWLAGTLAGPPDTPPGPPPLPGESGALSGAVQRVRRRLGPADDRDTPRADSAGMDRETERIRLFVDAPGGVPAPPYGSWWVEGTLPGRSTRRVEEFYRQQGLRVDPSAGPADYLPAELRFVELLLQHQRAALLTRRAELAEQALGREREFLQHFVRPWITRFCEGVRRATRQEFWAAVVDLLETFVEDEARRVGAT